MAGEAGREGGPYNYRHTLAPYLVVGKLNEASPFYPSMLFLEMAKRFCFEIEFGGTICFSRWIQWILNPKTKTLINQSRYLAHVSFLQSSCLIIDHKVSMLRAKLHLVQPLRNLCTVWVGFTGGSCELIC